MRTSRFGLVIAVLALVAGPAFAQQDHGPRGSGSSGGTPTGHGSSQGHNRPTGAQHPTVHPIAPANKNYQHDWQAFQHREGRARIFPHRYQGTAFPTPNAWRGNINAFHRDTWRRGGWRHERHDGRFGWWWVVGPSWYFYSAPVYPYPDSYTPPGELPGWWYWCDAHQEYYPFVTFCPGGWDRVLPRD